MREYTFWFMSNVMKFTLNAANEEAAWESLKQYIGSIEAEVPLQQKDGADCATLVIVNIDDEHRWELDEGDRDDNRSAVAAQEEIIE